MSAAEKIEDGENQEVSQFDLAENQAGHDDEPAHVKKVEEGEGPWLVSYADLMTLLMGFFALISSFSKPDMKEFEKVREAATQSFGGKLEKPYQELSQTLEKVIAEQGFGSQVKVRSGAEGVKIAIDGTVLFESGDFRIIPEGQEILEKIAQVIRQDKKDYKLLIEGHTDSQPIRHPIIGSNWELSGIRASRVAGVFEEQSIEKERLTIIGWGETKPLVPNYDKNGNPIEGNMAQNRRTVILVYDPKVSNEPVQSPE